MEFSEDIGLQFMPVLIGEGASRIHHSPITKRYLHQGYGFVPQRCDKHFFSLSTDGISDLFGIYPGNIAYRMNTLHQLNSCDIIAFAPIDYKFSW